jgi:predicted transcriptional regulator with HTH domain
MGQRIIISESDRNHIKKLYEGLNRKVLKEQLEYLDLVIEDDEDGFEVFIMDEDKKIGEISFVKELWMPQLMMNTKDKEYTQKQL